ncbi:MAG: DUF4860 domain-containing protein [Clostridiales bacterium]|nr:DUF4860 domain-containing protein [Candidatus Crickella merdequi]
MNLTPKKHFEISFPLLLLLLLSLCAIYIVLFAADTFESIEAQASTSNSARTSAAYIEEQIHQNDTESSAISVGALGDCDALIINKTINGKAYTSYTYCYDGYLREILAGPGLHPDPDMGTEITNLKSLAIKECSAGTLEFSCTDIAKNSTTKTICIRSRQ